MPWCESSVLRPGAIPQCSILLEGVSPVCAQRKHDLHQKLMRIQITRVAGEAVLSADLGELAGPVGQHRGAALVFQVGELTASRAIEPSTHKPAAAHLIVAGGVEAKGALFGRQLLALAPDKLTASHEGMIDGPPQRLPAHRGVNVVKLGEEVRALIVVAAGIGEAEVEVG